MRDRKGACTAVDIVLTYQWATQVSGMLRLRWILGKPKLTSGRFAILLNSVLTGSILFYSTLQSSPAKHDGITQLVNVSCAVASCQHLSRCSIALLVRWLLSRKSERAYSGRGVSVPLTCLTQPPFQGPRMDVRGSGRMTNRGSRAYYSRLSVSTGRCSLYTCLM